jgi:hypothetical protein|tara:strand:+ start:1853 stop:2131 length:279 start_codon:yes stop_codon:yes gene_type:complete
MNKEPNKFMFTAIDYNGNTMYWNGDNGWGAYEDAEIFNDKDRCNLKWPTNHRWVIAISSCNYTYGTHNYYTQQDYSAHSVGYNNDEKRKETK